MAVTVSPGSEPRGCTCVFVSHGTMVNGPVGVVVHLAAKNWKSSPVTPLYGLSSAANWWVVPCWISVPPLVCMYFSADTTAGRWARVTVCGTPPLKVPFGSWYSGMTATENGTFWLHR